MHSVHCCKTYLHIKLYTTAYMYSAQALTWHKGGIPQGEIWLKLGGDKGGGSFKMSFQVSHD